MTEQRIEIVHKGSKYSVLFREMGDGWIQMNVETVSDRSGRTRVVNYKRTIDFIDWLMWGSKNA